MTKEIIVGVSGGIDSSFSVLRLKEQGWRVHAVFLRMHDDQAEDDMQRLGELQRRYGIPVHEIDCQAQFQQNVINPFLEAYKRCETPNPCVICNAKLKIRLLIETADALGIERIATGHYAATVSYRGRTALMRTENKKDQTYMLARLPSQWLPRLYFPLAKEHSKRNVRAELAHSFGASVFMARESQNICFLRSEKLNDFLKRYIPPEQRRPGVMIDEQGHVLGQHEGLIFYTEGQRKGLGLSCGPWFVVSREPHNNQMCLRRGDEYKGMKIFFDRAMWQQPWEAPHPYRVQYCYRFAPVEAELSECSDDSGIVRLRQPSGGISLGQTLVLYDGNVLVGCGVITKVV